MKVLYLDCGMGAAGDMLTAALVELLPNPDEFIAELNALGICDVQVVRERAVKCGVIGTHISVRIQEEEANAEALSGSVHCRGQHYSDYGHTHKEKHRHRHMDEIEQIVLDMRLSEKVRKNVMAVYGMLVEAESHVYGMTSAKTHLREAAAKDTMIDIAAVCMLMDRLSPDEVVVSPVHVGCGHVQCAHGILPVPAPATAYILKDVPIYGGSTYGQLCTPTGAALLKHFATRFGDMPVMKVEAIGYGMGKKDFQAVNCVRAMLGVMEDKSDVVLELSCNVDDMTAEAVSFAMERLFEGGALEVYTVPVGMKKSRPGILIRVMCTQQDKENIVKLLFRHTTTIGIRETVTHRYALKRSIETLHTPYGDVRCKNSCGYGVSRFKYEYDDLACIAKENNVSIEEAEKLIEACR